MTVRDFLGFPSLQEVECSGGSLAAEVDLLSLTLFKMSENSILAVANPLKNTCMTFGEFSSCDISASNTRKSVVRTLVVDLKEGETTVLGCNVTGFLKTGHPRVYSWSLPVYRERKCLLMCLYCLFISVVVHVCLSRWVHCQVYCSPPPHTHTHSAAATMISEVLVSCC